MSIFSSIISRIFPDTHPAIANAAAPATMAPQAAQQAMQASATPSPQESANDVDVTAVLSQMASQRHENLNWQTSIVDLMKTLGLDSSLAARKELAKELHYEGDMSDTAQMNIWLQKQVMARLAANGGRVPDELLH